jgi:hypothetical protein
MFTRYKKYMSGEQRPVIEKRKRLATFENCLRIRLPVCDLAEDAGRHAKGGHSPWRNLAKYADAN